MESLLTPEILQTLIQTIGAVLVAILTKKAIPPPSEPGEETPEGQRLDIGRILRPLVGWMAAGVTGVLTFFVIGAILSLLFRPSVAITSPAEGQEVEITRVDTGSAYFEVVGTSKHVAGNPDLRIYVLVHPTEPFAAGWWVQSPSATAPDGRWEGVAWIGNPEFPTQSGHLVQIVAVAARLEYVQSVQHVDDPKDLRPRAMSSFVEFTIGEVKEQ